eukprot:m.76768 g.76768  ORF g.76768 m.76768 type:complete len:578 (-) comp10553_c0_seq2:4106-5839(-)
MAITLREWARIWALAVAMHCTAPVSAEQGGNTVCVVCVVVVALVEQMSEVHNSTVDKEVEKLCDLFPAGTVRTACDGLVLEYGPEVIRLLAEHETPDVVCHAVALCAGGCSLFPPPPEGVLSRVVIARTGSLLKGTLDRHGVAPRTAPPTPPGLPKICRLPGVRELCDIIYGFANNHLPLVDDDHDGFSTAKTFRGTDWRGQDCGPKDPTWHPGAKPVDDDQIFDSNCNGIFGVNPVTKVPYEKELCEGTGQVGMVVLGDSAAAHFHVPPEYFEAQLIGNHTFAHIEEILTNEFDWPMLSASTAFYTNTSSFPNIDGPVNSSYLVNRGRNRCAHRDYQNLGVNGARAGSMNSTIQEGLSRAPETDVPAFVLYALIGNDVCNGHPDTIAHMTTPADMQAEALATLAFLDTRLPKNSTVVMMGLADGRILYESLHNRIHPIGKLRGDVTYSQLYDFLNCLEISPCRGWMNSNETLRNATTERAEQLSMVLEQITLEHKFTNFEAHYIPNVFKDGIAEWVAEGREAWELIEPVDGFHPNQIANALTVDVAWRAYEKMGLLPPTNPHNAEIDKLFGDQGGY